MPLAVPLGLDPGDNEGVGVRVREPVPLGVQVGDNEGVLEGVPLPEGVSLAVPVCVRLFERVPDRVALGVPELLLDREGLAPDDSVRVGDRVKLGVLLPVDVREPLTVPLRELDGVPEPDAVMLGVLEPDAVMLGVKEIDGVTLGVLVCERVPDLLGVADDVRDRLRVLEGVNVRVRDGLRVLEGVNVGVREACSRRAPRGAPNHAGSGGGGVASAGRGATRGAGGEAPVHAKIRNKGSNSIMRFHLERR